ncbi:hypothetical protein [Gordonia soli]|uniref:Head-to-tail adaptor n=1 Tax=Gordonia soli NBRC 108243 TaxID=1223545 RepID=M0QQR9_9ACTN|nr:hypothetical protein [Gordonia soli]GAC71025.1 hypothetical protein GS4_47_00150 [Gordonia soli NBRC 108243]
MTNGEGAPFLTVTEFEQQWRPLSESEKLYAEQLLAAAARRIRNRVPEIAADDPDAKLVSFQVVRSALQSDALQASTAGHSSYTRTKTVGEKTESIGGTLTNPDALLLFTDFHWAQLGISPNPLPRHNFPRNDY